MSTGALKKYDANRGFDFITRNCPDLRIASLVAPLQTRAAYQPAATFPSGITPALHRSKYAELPANCLTFRLLQPASLCEKFRLTLPFVVNWLVTNFVH
jgi:hypothetical protein